MLARRRVLPLAALLAIVLAIVGLAAASYLAQQANIVEFRQSVFCKLIVPGMDRSDIESILSQYGSFAETESSTGDIVVIYISFHEPEVRERFGTTTFVLAFDGGKFVRATIPGFSESYRPVCEPPS